MKLLTKTTDTTATIVTSEDASLIAEIDAFIAAQQLNGYNYLGIVQTLLEHAQVLDQQIHGKPADQVTMPSDIIPRMLQRLDADEIHRVMEKMKWTWPCEDGQRTPTAGEIRQECDRYLRQLQGDRSLTWTGSGRLIAMRDASGAFHVGMYAEWVDGLDCMTAEEINDEKPHYYE